MQGLKILFLFLLASLIPSTAAAHGNEPMHSEMGRMAACKETLSLENVSVPHFAEIRWRLVSTLTTEDIRFTFYSDRAQRHIPVAALTATGVDRSGEVFMRVTWQEGESIRTFRPGIDAVVCQKHVGNPGGHPYDLRYTLNELKQRLIDAFFSK